MNRTVLYDQHLALGGAKMVDFAGWAMPIQYSSIIQEHRTIRSVGGIADISHMGRLRKWASRVCERFVLRRADHVIGRRCDDLGDVGAEARAFHDARG